MPAYYAQPIRTFLEGADEALLVVLQEGAAADFSSQWNALFESWQQQISTLRPVLRDLVGQHPSTLDWGIILEFPIPRRQRRIDAILLGATLAIILEFKQGADSEGINQLWDYTLDLADFHKPSKDLLLAPFLIQPNPSEQRPPERYRTGILSPRRTTPDKLAHNIVELLKEEPGRGAPPRSIEEWDQGEYHPVPTIIEAARAVFSGMDVREIAHSHAEAHNLTATVDAICEAVITAQSESCKVICFVTGVPGSGKTLAGLKAVHDPRLSGLTDRSPHFMSGNGPLVKVLREALVRDFVLRNSRSVADTRREVETLIQNVHVFASTYWDQPTPAAPYDRIVVFDEAQRAWNAKRNLRKFRRPVSEPEMLLGIMDRHEDWAVIVALVGGGQEINDGEAGLREWGNALTNSFRHWRVLASPEALIGGSAVAGATLFGEDDEQRDVRSLPELHLPTSTRAYRALAITEWSNELLEGRLQSAANRLRGLEEFPVYVTRSLGEARAWLRRLSMGSARCGLVASSRALRLRAYGLELATGFHRDYPYEYWFLNGREDVRSSYQLEVAATEFAIQGLELDWIGLCWGGDLLWNSSHQKWECRKFVGTKWQRIASLEEQQYVLNSYRVLLTRARQGLVICIPQANSDDPTLLAEQHDETARALRSSGLANLST